VTFFKSTCTPFTAIHLENNKDNQLLIKNLKSSQFLITLPLLKPCRVSSTTQSTGNICRLQDTTLRTFSQRYSTDRKGLECVYQLISHFHLIPFALHQHLSAHHLKGTRLYFVCSRQPLKSFCISTKVYSIC